MSAALRRLPVCALEQANNSKHITVTVHEQCKYQINLVFGVP